MANYGMKISLPGKDIKSISPSDFALNSKYGTFKAKNNMPNKHIDAVEGAFSGPFPQDQVIAIFNIPHGYNYTPAVMASLEVKNLNGSPTTLIGTGQILAGNTFYVGVISTPTDLVVLVYDNFNRIKNGTVLNFSYYIFAENGE